jgi:hypothetical protein
MQLPQYVTTAEVQRVCRELSLRDWTELSPIGVDEAEAYRIQQEVGGEALQVSTGEFRKGLEVELEHGLQFPDTNVTNNHPILTGKIVAAHLKESLDYYKRLEVAELEGDLLKAVKTGDLEKAGQKYRLMVAARQALAHQEWSQLE